MKYSNCLVAALKAKLKDWKNVHIRVYPLELNKGEIHFYWIDKDTVYHFVRSNKNEKNRYIFCGEVKEYRLKFFYTVLLHRMYQNGLSEEQGLRLSKKYHLPFSAEDIHEAYLQETME